MSFRTLLISEDPSLNGYLLSPLAQAILASAGKPAARVELLTSPRTRGYDHALQVIRNEVPEGLRYHDLWVFFPDADRASEKAMQRLEEDLRSKGVSLLCCPAQPEVDIYACVAYRKRIGLPWDEIRSHPRLKEEIFMPLLAQYGDPVKSGGGRDILIRESLRNLPLLFRLCPELKILRDRISRHISQK